MLNVQLFCRENCFEQVNFGQELRSVLQEQFMRITLRTLIVEMKLSEQCGELNGDSDEALYQDFIKNYVSNDSWLEQFYQNYPLLHRYVLETIQKTTTDICETIQRFYQDKDELKEYIGKANYIVCINGGSSDVHQGGKRVYFGIG